MCVVSSSAQRNVFVDFEFNGDSYAAFDDMPDDDVDEEATVVLQLENLDLDSVAGTDDDEPPNDVEVLCRGGLGTCEYQICHRWPVISTLLSYSYNLVIVTTDFIYVLQIHSGYIYNCYSVTHFFQSHVCYMVRHFYRDDSRWLDQYYWQVWRLLWFCGC